MAGRTNRLVSMAWRNIWRNKRRTAITISAVVFAVALSIWSWCVSLGEHEQMITDAIKLLNGHIQVHAKGYWDDRTIYKSFSPPKELMATLAVDKRVKAFTTRLNVEALISSDTNTSGVMLIGIEPDREFSSVKKKIVAGSFLSTGDKNGIIIGETLAKNLKVDIGGTLTVIAQAIDGSMGAQLYKVIGIFRSGSIDLDRSMAFITLPSAQYLLSMDGLVSEVSMLLVDNNALKKTYNDISNSLDPKTYEVMRWEKLIPDMVQLVDMDSFFGYVFYLMILIVVIFGILNTILMAVMERYREFGVMMALGTRPREIVTLIMVESAFIALAGIIIGNIVGFLVSYYYTIYPMDFSDYAKSFETFGLNPLIYAKIEWFVFYISDIIVLVATLLSAVYPSIKASRLSPVRALRYI